MLPYASQPSLSLGGIRIPAFGLLAVSAILTGRWMFVRRARRFGFSYAGIAPLYMTLLIAGFAGALIAGTPGRILPRAGFSSIGAVAGALAAGAAYCRIKRYDSGRCLVLLDIAAFAAPFAAAVGRLGCTLAHDHRGLSSTGWLAFRFPEGPRYDLGFVDFIFLVALCGAFLLLDRKPRPAGFFFGIAATTYGAFRVWRATLAANPGPVPWVLIAITGVLAWALARRRAQRFAC